jgi:hypothetical protein
MVVLVILAPDTNDHHLLVSETSTVSSESLGAKWIVLVPTWSTACGQLWWYMGSQFLDAGRTTLALPPSASSST